MQKKFQVLITFVILVALITGLYMFTNWFSIITGYFTGESEQAVVAQCLQYQGAEFYTSEYCADCARQEEEFGVSFDMISKVDCGKDKELCPNIRELPAWYIPNSEAKINYGFKTLNELKELGNCE
ncbi:MAG: hypothetical protein KKF39_03815 [Nanoarchaeota archaeon]|nr:hypothetical protein [Nanoarchaeota archaeon]